MNGPNGARRRFGPRMATTPHFWRRWRTGILLLVFMALVAATYGLVHQITTADAACGTYVVQRGDTLNQIATRYHTTANQLAQWNQIRNVNMIYVGQRLCVSTGQPVGDPLEWSNPGQVRQLLLRAADRHGLPHNLVLAIAWQESNWTQHVIAWDGGVGTMQLMPYTTAWLNNALHTSYNPYRLADNIELGTAYLRMLWNEFGGYLPRVISAYNEGSGNVRTRGIFNWFYVDRVLSHMRWIN